MKNLRETLMHIVFFVCALTSIAAVVLICLFLFANGIPAMKEIGLLNFLTGAKWKPGNDIYGILPMILGSIYITAGAVVIGVPVGLLTLPSSWRSTARKSSTACSSPAPSCSPASPPSSTAFSAWSSSCRVSAPSPRCSVRTSPARPSSPRPCCSAS